MSTDVAPAMFNHCITVWDAMREEATEMQDHLVYEGFLTKLFEKCYLSVPYYTHVMDELQRMGCVVQLRRGGGSAKSQWELVQRPNPTLWEQRSGRSRRQKKVQALDDSATQMLRDMQNQINRLYEFTGCPRGE